MKKPIDIKTHAINDYVFGAVQLAGPSLLGINKKAASAYQLLGTAFTTVNALTDTPVGTSVISVKTHQKADLSFLGLLSALTFSKMIKNDKKALGFHLGFLALTLMNYLMTDYDARSSKPTAF